MCTIDDYAKLQMDADSRATLRAELDPVWHRFYLSDTIKGRLVIDLGADCGSTALFYLLHGAAAVVAVESDRRKFDMLRSNFAGDGRVVPVLGDIGHVKMDIEGAERGSMIAVHNALRPVYKHTLWNVEHIFKIE